MSPENIPVVSPIWPECSTREDFLAAIYKAPPDVSILAKLYLRFQCGRLVSGKRIADVARLEDRLWSNLSRADQVEADRLRGDGFTPIVIFGRCLGREWPERSTVFSRHADIAAGDAVSFISDAIPEGMVKLFIGWRYDPSLPPTQAFLQKPEDREFLFLSHVPLFIMAVPAKMLRHVERIEYVKPPRRPSYVPAPDQDAVALGQSLGLKTHARAEGLPRAGNLYSALSDNLTVLRDRALALPSRPPSVFGRMRGYLSR